MKKISVILVTALLTASRAALAQQLDLTDTVCQVSESCKKVCQFDIADKFNELSDDQKRLTIQCAQDMIQKLNLDKMAIQQQTAAPKN